MWLLIVMTLAGEAPTLSADHAPIIAMHEFKSEADCQLASKAIYEMTSGNTASWRISKKCVLMTTPR